MNSVLGSALLYCLISSQERANKHKLYLIFNTKQPKIIFNLKSKLNQVFVFVLALRDYQLLCQVSENGNSASNYNYIHPTIYIYIDILEIISYLQANPYRLKIKIINSLIFISIITE